RRRRARARRAVRQSHGLAARIVGWSGPARGHRPRAGAAATGVAAGRAVLGARCGHPRGPSGPPAQSLGRIQADAGSGHARCRRGDCARRSDRGDAAAPWPAVRRDRHRIAPAARSPVGGVRCRQAAGADRAGPGCECGRTRAKGCPGRRDVVVTAGCRDAAAGVGDRHCYNRRSSLLDRPPIRATTAGGPMKSFQVCTCGEPLQCNEYPTPAPKGTEVLLKVIAAGVCHSDLHLSDGYFDLGGGKRLSVVDRGMRLPVTLGHENVGEVAAVGPDAHGVTIGDRRLVDPWMGCGECGVCRRGDEQLCTKPTSLGVFRDGGYSDFLMVPHPRYLFDIGDIPPERAAPLACSGVTTYSAVVVDIDPAKREAAKRAGAVAVIDGGANDAAKQIIAATDGGAWAAIDLVGSAATVRLGLNSLAKGGKLILVGLYGGEITLSLPPFPMRAISLQGSYTGSLTETAELIELVKRTGLPPVPVATRPLTDVNAVLNELRAGKVIGRVVLTPAS